MQPIIRQCGPVTSEIQQTSWGAHLRVRGVMGMKEIQPVMGGIMEDMRKRPRLAAVCDYREADVCLAARHILKAHRQAAPEGRDWPAALVVNPAHLEIWRDYAWLQGQRGNLRRIFTEHEAANRWAQEQAALQEVHLRWIERVQSTR